jgi:hypothetical protein
VFGQKQDLQKPAIWQEQLDQPEWTENVIKHMPSQVRRRLPHKQHKDEAFLSISEVAEE